jgi:hypothetical protein
MTPCTALSDRMPGVALGRSEWTDEEARHLVDCADCRAEWAVVSAAQRLGASLPLPVDPAVTAARVLGRVASERARTRSRARVWMAGALAAAAVLGLAVWTRGGGSRATVPATPSVTSPVAVEPGAPDMPTVVTRPAPREVELPLPELDSLPAEALDSMLRVLDEPLARADADAGPLGDAGDQELARALAGLEG